MSEQGKMDMEQQVEQLNSNKKLMEKQVGLYQAGMLTPSPLAQLVSMLPPPFISLSLSLSVCACMCVCMHAHVCVCVE